MLCGNGWERRLLHSARECAPEEEARKKAAFSRRALDYQCIDGIAIAAPLLVETVDEKRGAVAPKKLCVYQIDARLVHCGAPFGEAFRFEGTLSPIQV